MYNSGGEGGDAARPRASGEKSREAATKRSSGVVLPAPVVSARARGDATAACSMRVSRTPSSLASPRSTRSPSRHDDAETLAPLLARRYLGRARARARRSCSSTRRSPRSCPRAAAGSNPRAPYASRAAGGARAAASRRTGAPSPASLPAPRRSHGAGRAGRGDPRRRRDRRGCRIEPQRGDLRRQPRSARVSSWAPAR